MKTEKRNGYWLQTYSGGRFWPFDPKPEDVDIEDIAHSLSLTCRFNGHTEFFYSVAQHSLYVVHYLETEGHSALWQLRGLLHDASEAYLGDITTPIKATIPIIKKHEENLLRCIWKSFGIYEQGILSGHDYSIIKKADLALLWAEKRDVIKPNIEWWSEEVEPWDNKIFKMGWSDAKLLFLRRFYQLDDKVKGKKPDYAMEF